jgi:Sulfatase-modifying factor enzyme 1
MANRQPCCVGTVPTPVQRLLRQLPTPLTAALDEAWARTDVLFGALDASLAGGSLGEWTRLALLAQPISGWPPFLYLLGHLPMRSMELLGPALGVDASSDPEQAAMEQVFSPNWGGEHQPGEDELPDVVDILRFRYRLLGRLRAELRAATANTNLDRALVAAIRVELEGHQTLLSMAQLLPLGALRVSMVLPWAWGTASDGGAPDRVTIPQRALLERVGRPRAEVVSFAIRRSAVTVANWQEFVAAGGYVEPSFWEGAPPAGRAAPRNWRMRPNGQWMVRLPLHELPLDAAGQLPVQVDAAEAAAYARYEGGRLPTPAEVSSAALDLGDIQADGLVGVSVAPPPRSDVTTTADGVDGLLSAGWVWTSERSGASTTAVGGPWAPESAAVAVARVSLDGTCPWYQTQVRVVWSL